MKKHTLFIIWPLLPLVLWSQSEEFSDIEIDMSEVIIVEDASSNAEPSASGSDSPAPESAPDLMMEPAEISEVPVATEVQEVTVEPIEEVIVTEVAATPEITESLPENTEVVLQISGEEATDSAQASVQGKDTISIDFPDEDVRTILRNIADLFELNLVIPDTLQGRTTVKLRNVSWEQAFDVVLEPLGFTHVKDENIISVKSVEDLTTEPVETEVFVINYARASEIQQSIAPLVDSAVGGRIQVNARSNALVITERPSRMGKIQLIIGKLDKATKQVMIESKFVEVRTTVGKDLGVDWSALGGETGGVNLGLSDTVGALNSGAESFIVEEVQGALGQPVTSTSSGDVLTGNPFDTAVFSSSSFGAVLKALNSNNDIKLVSNPTVVTMDNEQALIKITREFPQPDFTFNAETGQRQFNGLGDPIDVGITLMVTPTVNDAGFINLDIFPEVSSTSEDRVIEGTLFPIRDVRTAQTRIMIKDGFTIALGGLVTRDSSVSNNKVPLLGSLPGVGRLFSSESEETVESNLIIFITAKTLNPDGTTYRDTVDPRLLDRMEITPDAVPGYEVPSEERALLERLEEIRFESSQRAARARAQEEIDARQSPIGL
jgi:type IV pilus assembly protein PilQ